MSNKLGTTSATAVLIKYSDKKKRETKEDKKERCQEQKTKQEQQKQKIDLSSEQIAP